MLPPVRRSALFSRALGLSLGLHGGLALLFGAMSLFDGRFRGPPQNVLTARLVRLGTPRPETLLPHKVAPAALPPPARPNPPPISEAPVKPPVAAQKEPTPASAAAPKAVAPTAAPRVLPEPRPAPQDARARIQELGKVNQALDRLRRQTDGQRDGSSAGETDLAQEGDLFATAVKTCLERNYVIEGADPARVRGLTAQVVLRIRADGTIMGFHLARASGVKAFDDAVARAVKRCHKTPPPPPAWRRVVGQEGIEIEFHP